MKITDAFIDELSELMDGMSGMVVFRVTGKWANRGRTGDIDTIVAARDAIEAAQMSWGSEDNADLRSIHVEWLCPVECMIAMKRQEIDEMLGE